MGNCTTNEENLLSLDDSMNYFLDILNNTQIENLKNEFKKNCGCKELDISDFIKLYPRFQAFSLVVLSRN